MAVSRKPAASAASVPVDVDALIRKGGSVPEDEATSSLSERLFPLRFASQVSSSSRLMNY